MEQKKGFQWPAVGWSVIDILGTMFALTSVVAIVIAFASDAQGIQIPAQIGVIVGFAGYFMGGLVAGYRSPGVTVLEPAVAAALVTALYLIIAKASPLVAIVPTILVFGLSYAGAWLGERIQARASS